MRTVELPGGVSAVIRDPGEMTERQRRIIRTSLFDVLGGEELTADQLENPDGIAVKLTPKLGSQMFEMRDAAIVAALVSWSLPDPVPTVDTVQDLPANLYDALAKETAGVLDGIMVDFSPTPEADSPTRPSSVSDGLLRGAETPIPQPLISGVNTSIASSTT